MALDEQSRLDAGAAPPPDAAPSPMKRAFPANLATLWQSGRKRPTHRHQAQCMAHIGSGKNVRDPHEPRDSEHLRPALF
jgi:hypothetical protein